MCLPSIAEGQCEGVANRMAAITASRLEARELALQRSLRLATIPPLIRGVRTKAKAAMNVVLVHDWLTGMRGGEKCLEVLCRAFPDARLLTLLHRPGSTSPAIERMRITTSFLQHVPGNYRYLLPLMPRAIRSLHVPPETDLVVSLSHAVAKGVCVPPGVPHVCFCFTPMRYAWHLREQYFGRGRSWRRPLAAARGFILDRLRDWDRTTGEQIEHYVAISRTVADRIVECYGRPSTVIYPPVDTDFYTPAPVAREDFYLVVSALVPYKRIELAIEACRRLGRKLLIAGSGPERPRLERCAGPETTFLGWQDNASIRALLRTCRALLFTPLEDFGIVPLEAQACGAPVIALGAGGATETIIASDERRTGTGLFFAEQTAESLADAIEWFEGHADRISPDLARRQAERFAVARFEQELVGYLRNVVADRDASRFSQQAAQLPLRRAG